jgi:hypothetical protein
MKKVFMIMLIAITSITASYGFNKEDYYGTWIEDSLQKISIEITADSIFIDEIGNEGDGYTYEFDTKTNTFALYDEIYGKLSIVMQFPLWTRDNDKLNIIICGTDHEGCDDIWIDKKL